MKSLFFLFFLFTFISPAHATLQFTQACHPASAQISIAAVGDVLLHTPLQRQASQNLRSGRFTTLWRPVELLLSQAGITYANFEGPAAYGMPLGSYPAFNYHPSLIEDLLSSGVDIVSTANNHALDRGAQGADRTIESMRRYGLPFTGTRSSKELNQPATQWMQVTHLGGFSLAWIACTYGTNGIRDPYHQVLNCFQDATLIETLIRNASYDSTIDAVIVTPHWGQEYQHKPEPAQVNLAKRFFQAGALAIIGSHPHVLQPWEKVMIGGRERFIIYSLGNFVSGQGGTPKRTSVLLYLGLSRGPRGQVWINGVRNIPLLMTNDQGRYQVEPLNPNDPNALRGTRPAEALSLVRRLFGSGNEMQASDRLITNPHCK